VRKKDDIYCRQELMASLMSEPQQMEISTRYYAKEKGYIHQNTVISHKIREIGGSI